MDNKLKFILIFALLILACAQFAWKFMPLPDFVDGMLLGVSIGLLISILWKRK